MQLNISEIILYGYVIFKLRTKFLTKKEFFLILFKLLIAKWCE
jgi:hypothetical protein